MRSLIRIRRMSLWPVLTLACGLLAAYSPCRGEDARKGDKPAAKAEKKKAEDSMQKALQEAQSAYEKEQKRNEGAAGKGPGVAADARKCRRNQAGQRPHRELLPEQRRQSADLLQRRTAIAPGQHLGRQIHLPARRSLRVQPGGHEDRRLESAAAAAGDLSGQRRSDLCRRGRPHRQARPKRQGGSRDRRARDRANCRRCPK